MRVKRTYKLSVEAVATVRELAERKQVAATQDAVVEVAIRELARRVRETDDAERWARAAADPEFVAEAGQLAREFASDDRAAWPG
ncbi:MAG: hypothetical protein ACJ77A_16265 [Actinomycetota bacterium]